MNILAIDTSTNVLGVGLISQNKVLGEYITNVRRNHSTRVLPAIEFLLEDCGIELKDIDQIAVAAGPGSYTGLRIGITIAKTLAWTLKIPLVGVSSLMMMASTARYFNGLISPIMDARRGNVYTGLYKYSNGKLTQIIEDQHVSIESWAKQLKELNHSVLFVGEDVHLHQATLATELIDQANFAPMTVNIQRPGELGLLALQNEPQEVHTFVPNYVRLAEAEMKWREKTGN